MYKLMSLVFVLATSAQAIIIQGRVISEETGFSVSGATISVNEKYSITDKDGCFTLDAGGANVGVPGELRGPEEEGKELVVVKTPHPVRASGLQAVGPLEGAGQF